jgi:hypothetical protein
MFEAVGSDLALTTCPNQSSPSTTDAVLFTATYNLDEVKVFFSKSDEKPSGRGGVR